jgi:hypothetical protein
MATVTTAFFSAPDVLLTAPATLPTCSVRRTDTGAVVSSGNMSNLGGGLYSFTFATVDGLEYAAICDGDPIVAGQTFLGARYRDGAISGTTTERVEVDVPAILADTAAMQPTVAANLDAQVSLVETEAAAAARAVTNQAEHDATQADIAALNDLSQADVQSAMTAQGYTAARSLLLDNLDALVSSRSSHTAADVDAQLSGTHGAGSWATAAGFAVPGDLMGLVAGAITSAKVAADAFTGTQFDATMQSYQGKVWNFDDDLAGTPADRYGVAFFKNGNFVTAGITSPTLRVVRTSDGVDLVAPVALVPVPGFPGLFGYEETSAPARMIDGVGYFALVSATLDAGTRTWPQQIGRDNTP